MLSVLESETNACPESAEQISGKPHFTKPRVLCPYLVKQPYLVFALKNGKNGYGRNF
jgi:hypothetical protein